MDAALIALLNEKDFEYITIKEICQKAGVNRSTFYFYYNDISDMMIQLQDEIFSVFEEKVLNPSASFITVEDFTNYCIRFLLFCKEYENICKFVISNDPNNNLANKIRKCLLEKVPDSDKVFPENDPKRYLTCYFKA